MRKLTLTLVLLAGLFKSCSSDEDTVLNERQVALKSGNCTNASALSPSATLSGYTGPEITFNWNNFVIHAAYRTHISKIEIMEDPACPPPAGAPPVAASYPIDVFNTSSLTIPGGVSAKCFYWRIVIKGYVNSVLDCTTTTEWMPATYVQ